MTAIRNLSDLSETERATRAAMHTIVQRLDALEENDTKLDRDITLTNLRQRGEVFKSRVRGELVVLAWDAAEVAIMVALCSPMVLFLVGFVGYVAGMFALAGLAEMGIVTVHLPGF